jgi:hypothetical protein
MPYEHDAPAATYEAPERRRPWFVPPAPFRWSPASAVVATVLSVPLLLTGWWHHQGRWFGVLFLVLVVSRPLAWLLWTRRP